MKKRRLDWVEIVGEYRFSIGGFVGWTFAILFMTRMPGLEKLTSVGLFAVTIIMFVMLDVVRRR